MAGRKKDRGLGRGLSALMSDSGLNEAAVPVAEDDAPLETKSASSPDSAPPLARTPEEAKLVQTLVDTRKGDAPLEQPNILHVAISRLQRNPDQPRKVFARDKLDDLIASIQQKGVLQPILVRGIDDGQFQIVAGERRWQAALRAGLTSIPVMVRDLSDRDVLEIGVIENVQRADLNPLEEALAYERLITEFGRTQAEIATTIGKSRVHVANTVRLTGLTPRGRDLLMTGAITAGHARALLAADDPDALAEAIVEKALTVRDAERWAQGDKSPKLPARKTREKPADIIALEQRIQDETGFPADIRQSGKRGEIRLKYNDLDHLQALLQRMGLMGG
ncbi:ParB/RepB/Spo0J family partition protein [Algimonas porphyrae]|uniref:Chromosome-partitioning protein ParB n=1 Tax=Algimonas porphyrae TaxID=1128113 RepID=A0ABQ5V1U8_9PROT|nr:ParB/RepB/Spo0J family partition protein [Algimonas porphyrae]GLQ20556.1 chromosome-partitioning protein ParB [Algimonas porphyrae]